MTPNSLPRPGVERSEVDYVWPTTIARPEAPTLVVYLDLNHWIGLAKAATTHPDGQRYRHCPGGSSRLTTQACVRPLGASTTWRWRPSPARGRGPTSRRSWRSSQVSPPCLSGFDVMRLEIDAAVAKDHRNARAVCPSRASSAAGVLQAFGRRRGLTRLRLEDARRCH